MKRIVYKLPLELDSARLTQAIGGDQIVLFERFDLHTRIRTHGIVGLRWQQVSGERFEDSLRQALAGARADATHLVFCGSDERLVSSAAANDFPPFFILRLDEYLEIDPQGGKITHICADGQASLQPDTLRRALDVAASAPSLAVPTESPSDAPHWQAQWDAAGHDERVGSLQARIACGEIDGAVLSVGLSTPTQADPLDIYREMVRINPSTFGFCLNLQDRALVGCSPLAFLDMDGGVLRLETDAGTRPVTGLAIQDAQARKELLNSAKDASEHALVVREETQSLEGIADCVERVVDREVRAFSHVMHLYTVLQARLRQGIDLARAVMHLFPPAAVSGRPRDRARDIGLELEEQGRGPYGGLVGLVRGQETAELAVVIRSLWVAEGRAFTRVGGKIVAHSLGPDEYAEALNKARFMEQSVALAEAVRT